MTLCVFPPATSPAAAAPPRCLRFAARGKRPSSVSKRRLRFSAERDEWQVWCSRRRRIASLSPVFVGDWERGRIAGCLGVWYDCGLGRD